MAHYRPLAKISLGPSGIPEGRIVKSNPESRCGFGSFREILYPEDIPAAYCVFRGLFIYADYLFPRIIFASGLYRNPWVMKWDCQWIAVEILDGHSTGI